MRIASLLVAVLLLVTHGPASVYAQDLTPEGVWLHNNNLIQVKIAPCKEYLCGTIVWLKNPDDAEGSPIADSENPDQAKRGRLVMGMTVLSGLIRSSPDQWTGGTLYHPDDDKTYKARVTMAGPDMLNVRAYVLLSLFGKTKVWTRVQD